jgi:glycosyltransferase involved in cell wall biosynthesis
LKILVISQYFWPENFRVNDLCLELQNRGHDVSVLTGKPNYPNGSYYKNYNFYNKRIEFNNGVRIYRCFLVPRGAGGKVNLFLNYISFAFFSSLRLLFLRDKFDKIIVYQLSPATVGFPGLIAKYKFKAPLYFYIQDLWPESISDAGGLNNRYILYAVDQMMKIFYQNSTEIWVQSIGFVIYLKNKGINISKIKYIPNTVEKFYIPQGVISKYYDKFPIGFNILFAGNIGIAQDFETIIKAAQILNSIKVPVNWIIIGDGSEKKNILDLIEKCNLSNRFYFLGSFPSEDMPYYFACADALLVSLKKTNIFSLTIPSKLQSYLACRKPIIGNVDGVAYNIIKDSNCGVCSISGDYKEFAKNVEKLFNKSRDELNNYSNNSYNFFLNNFERKLVYDLIDERLNS